MYVADMNTPTIISTESVLKRRNTVEWWYFGPVILAVVMFLLMGTIFERRIEAFYRRILERRQAHLAQQTENIEIPLCGDRTTSLHTVKTPSQRTIGSYRAGSSTTDFNPQPVELTSQCIP
ncbi:hypothetical protein SFRURICE_019746 [Spodoptera frugiperda]|uniref:SFRICE_011349 n=1 Tax=Spodoptera frugiperda TaxID=7108 RepID=A0A2H1VEB3_SPOFR|nr:hypothetical protein SFRURICE_019746 [Spodoptera frugiperda]